MNEEGWTTGFPGPFPTSHPWICTKITWDKAPIWTPDCKEQWRKLAQKSQLWDQSLVFIKRKLCASCRPVPNACKIVQGIESLLPLVRDGAGGGRDTRWPQKCISSPSGQRLIINNDRGVLRDSRRSPAAGTRTSRMKGHSTKPAGHSAANPSWASYTSLLQPLKTASKTEVSKILPARCNSLRKNRFLQKA